MKKIILVVFLFFYLLNSVFAVNKYNIVNTKKYILTNNVNIIFNIKNKKILKKKKLFIDVIHLKIKN